MSLNSHCLTYFLVIMFWTWMLNKTIFFAINGIMHARRCFILYGFNVEWSDRFTFLGSLFTCYGNPSSPVSEHVRMKWCHLLKSISFVNNNRDIPFDVKKRIFKYFSFRMLWILYYYFITDLTFFYVREKIWPKGKKVNKKEPLICQSTCRSERVGRKWGTNVLKCLSWIKSSHWKLEILSMIITRIS